MALNSNLIKDSVSKIAVSRYLCVIIMATCIIKSHSLPVTPDAESASPWWCQPCQNQHRTRHSRAINEVLKDQFKSAIANCRNIVSPYLKQIHTKIGDVTKKQFNRNKWLPRKKFFKSLEKGNKKILPELLYQLQIFALTIETLSNMDIRSQDASFNLEQRKSIMNQIKADINLLRCETEQEMVEKKQISTKKVPPNLLDKKIPRAVNHISEGLIKDFSILKNYTNFLKKCYGKIFGKSKRTKDRNAEKPKSKKVLKNKINGSS